MIGTMTWAAMDVHARSTYAASLDVMTGELTRRRFDTGAVEPVVAWLAGLSGPVRACYEAGPTGFGLYRAAGAAGIDCQVIAPSKTPRPSGDRNKSDRRDTDLLLRQLMAGALTPVAVPPATFEAARDLARAREQIRADLMRCRHRLSKLLLRHGRVYDRKAWTQAHRQWLAAQSFEQVNTELAFVDNLAACDGLVARKQALDERLSRVARDPEFWPLVARFRAFRGLDTLSALIIVLEVRLHAVRSRRAARIVAWAGALAPAVRRIRHARADHQDRLAVRPPDPRRSGLALHPPTPHRPGARRAPRRPARPHPPDRLARAASPAPHPPTDARAQKAGQRDHRCVRPRARLLPLGSRHRPITQADSPPARVGRRRAPKSAGTRGNTMGSPYQATPVLRHASAGDETRDLGCQPPHMRLTDVEDAPDASPREPKTLNPPATGGTMNAAHLTNVPPYEC